MNEPNQRRSPYNSRGQLQVALPRRKTRKDRKKTTPPAIDNKQVQKTLNDIKEDYRARLKWWEHILAREPAKRAEKRLHVRQRMESLQQVCIYIARVERELGIQTHPETRR